MSARVVADSTALLRRCRWIASLMLRSEIASAGIDSAAASSSAADRPLQDSIGGDGAASARANASAQFAVLAKPVCEQNGCSDDVPAGSRVGFVNILEKSPRRGQLSIGDGASARSQPLISR
jgi:hypothetical protein